jgi:hypothetical protein
MAQRQLSADFLSNNDPADDGTQQRKSGSVYSKFKVGYQNICPLTVKILSQPEPLFPLRAEQNNFELMQLIAFPREG